MRRLGRRIHVRRPNDYSYRKGGWLSDVWGSGNLLSGIRDFSTVSLGLVLDFEAARADSTLAYSLTSRLIGGLLSLVVFALCIGGPRWGKIRTSLAWILALGVAVVVVIDNLSPQAATVASQAIVWLIAGVVVAVHVFGALAARRVALE